MTIDEVERVMQLMQRYRVPALEWDGLHLAMTHGPEQPIKKPEVAQNADPIGPAVRVVEEGGKLICEVDPDLWGGT